MLAAFPLILANNFESFVAGAFMVIAFVGWIINLVGQNQPAGQQKRRAQGPRPDGPKKTAKAEIEKFLDQSRHMNRPPQHQERVSSDGVEVIERPQAAPQRRPPPTTQRRRTKKEVWEAQVGQGSEKSQREPSPQTKKAPPPSTRTAPPVANRPGESLTERHLQKMQSRQASRPVNRIEQSVARDLASHLKSDVAAHLGNFRASSQDSSGERALASTTDAVSTQAMKLGQLLKSKSGMQAAILMSEIMAKPRALR